MAGLVRLGAGGTGPALPCAGAVLALLPVPWAQEKKAAELAAGLASSGALAPLLWMSDAGEWGRLQDLALAPARVQGLSASPGSRHRPGHQPRRPAWRVGSWAAGRVESQDVRPSPWSRAGALFAPL